MGTMALFSAPNVEVGRGYRKEAQVFPPSSFLQLRLGMDASQYEMGTGHVCGTVAHHGTMQWCQ